MHTEAETWTDVPKTSGVILPAKQQRSQTFFLKQVENIHSGSLFKELGTRFQSPFDLLFISKCDWKVVTFYKHPTLLEPPTISGCQLNILKEAIAGMMMVRCCEKARVLGYMWFAPGCEGTLNMQESVWEGTSFSGLRCFCCRNFACSWENRSSCCSLRINRTMKVWRWWSF